MTGCTEITEEDAKSRVFTCLFSFLLFIHYTVTHRYALVIDIERKLLSLHGSKGEAMFFWAWICEQESSVHASMARLAEQLYYAAPTTLTYESSL